MTIVWLNTQPNPNPRHLDTGWDHGQRGWRFHAVLGNESESMQAVQGRRALCGLRPRHGWHIDLFMDDGDRCLRCEKKAGLPMSEQNSARARVVMGRISVDAEMTSSRASVVSAVDRSRSYPNHPTPTNTDT